MHNVVERPRHFNYKTYLLILVINDTKIFICAIYIKRNFTINLQLFASLDDMSNMKVFLIFSIFVVYFVSCYGALNVTEELMFLKETVLLQKERIDGLQQTVGDILQRNEQSVPSDTPQLADITQREDDVFVEKSSKWIKKNQTIFLYQIHIIIIKYQL